MKRAIFTLFALILTGTAFGWGTIGHKVVIAIAQRHLTEKTKANIAKYIDYDLKKDAVWMDKHRNDEPIAYTTHYHVFAADKNLRYDPNYRLAEGGDVVYALAISEYNLAEQNYKQLTDSAVVFNLRMIIHFMGDMHCPVHTHIDGVKTIWKCKLNGQEWAQASGESIRVITELRYASSISCPITSIGAASAPGSNFTIDGSVILATSATISLSTGDVTCAPSDQNTLYPLYSLGL